MVVAKADGSRAGAAVSRPTKAGSAMALLFAAGLASTAFAQSHDNFDPNQPVVTGFEAGAPVQVPAGATLLDTRPQLITHPGGGSGGLDESRLQNTSLGMSTAGFGVQSAGPNRIAEDFVVPAPGWEISDIAVYAYQTGSTTTSTLTALNFQIWDGDPSLGTSTVVFGDGSSNRLSSTAFTNIFRASETAIGATNRPVMAATASGLSIVLPPGTYWLDWQLSGSLASGPWAPPITLIGQAVTGNGQQSLAGTWGPALDGGAAAAAQGFPMTISGVVNEADVGISKVANGAGSLMLGSNFSYTLSVSNNGPATATGVVVSDDLPAQLAYVSDTCGASFVAPTLTWTIGSMANAASQMCTVNVSVVSGGAISNTASVTSSSNDPTPGNDSATAVVTGAPLDVDLALDKTVMGSSTVEFGRTVSYLLSVSNAGPGDADGVIVTDSLPAGLSYLSNDCGASYLAPSLTWTIGTLANAASVQCTLVATVANLGPISNSATVTTTSNDPNAGNDLATAVISGVTPIAVPSNTARALLTLILGLLVAGAWRARVV